MTELDTLASMPHLLAFGFSQHERILHAAARAGELDQAPVMHYAVDQRAGHLVVAEHRPLFENSMFVVITRSRFS